MNEDNSVVVVVVAVVVVALLQLGLDDVFLDCCGCCFCFSCSSLTLLCKDEVTAVAVVATRVVAMAHDARDGNTVL